MTNVLNIESPKNLKSWLKSTFEKSLGQAIDLELATGLCLNEIALTVKEKAHDEASLKLYAYLVIKLSQALSRGEVCIELSHVYDLSQKTGVLNKNLDAYLQRYATLHTISLADGAESLKQLSETNPYDLVVNYPLVVMQGRLYFSRYWFYQQQVFYSISTRLHLSLIHI